MSLPRPASPRALWNDLRAFAGQRSLHHYVAAVAAVLMPVVIIVLFYFDGKTNILPGEQVIYVESWSADRSDEEILAQQKVNEERRQAIAEERQRQFQRLERRLGL